MKFWIDAGHVARRTLDAVRPELQAGKSWVEIIDFAERFIRRNGGQPAFPTTIAEKIRASAKNLQTGFLSSSRILSLNPFWEIIPSLAAISCKTIQEKTESNRAQSREYPKLTPAKVQEVTVPGPIKAAETNIPGPNSFK